MLAEYFLLTFAIGILLGALGVWGFLRFKLGHFKTLAQGLLNQAQSEAELLQKKGELAAKQVQMEYQRESETWLQKEKRKIQEEQDRLQQREDKLERRMGLIEKKLSDIEKREALIALRKNQLDEERKGMAEKQSLLLAELENMASLSATDAKALLLEQMSHQVQNDAAMLTRRIQKEYEEEADRIATSIITTAINRLALPCVSEATVTTVPIPNDEMKGRIIGRDGRNIRTLERVTGINFLIDDTPGAVVLSGFDPIRKHVAKVALTDLVMDGRIHPARIEEVVEKTTQTVHKQIKQHGEDAALRAGAVNLHPELIQLLGKLKFRYSYGQNVLDHSLEVSYLMGIMAAELGLNPSLAKRIGLLHDIGKAVSHEMPGSHAVIGHNFALKYGEKAEVANGIGCHHGEMDPTSAEAALCESADRISAYRPGARVEAVEEYFKRLTQLEEAAYEFPGVEHAYAMQAGREIRIVVLPEMIDDHGALNLARDLTKKIEQELTYPGKIKVTVIREKRVVHYAV